MSPYRVLILVLKAPQNCDSTPLIRWLSVQIIYSECWLYLCTLQFSFSNAISRIKSWKAACLYILINREYFYIQSNKRKNRTESPSRKVCNKKERDGGDTMTFMPLVFDSFEQSNAISVARNNSWLFSRQRWDLGIKPTQWMSLVVLWLAGCGHSNLVFLVTPAELEGWCGGDLPKWRISVRVNDDKPLNACCLCLLIQIKLTNIDSI